MKYKLNNRIISRVIKFIDRHPEIVSKIQKVSLYNDEPQVYQYMAYLNDRYKTNSDGNSVACGISFDKDRALQKLFGEIIERYALSINNEKKFIFDSYNNLKDKALDPEIFVPFSKLQIKRMNINYQQIKNTQIHWVWGSSIYTDKKVLIPAQLVYVPYLFEKEEPVIRYSISTGAASGTDLNHALYSGICEIVERDSYMLAYLNKRNCNKINISSLRSPNLIRVVESITRYNLEVHIVNITSDLNIFSVAALIIDRTGKGPAVSIGLKAGFDAQDVIQGAIEEAIMTRGWTRDNYNNQKILNPKKIKSIEERAFYWAPLFMAENISFWLNGEPKDFKNNRKKSSQYKDLISSLKKQNIEAYYVNISSSEIAELGISVVKAIIPSLHPLYLDERYPYLGGKRLLASNLMRKYNEIPHPFL